MQQLQGHWCQVAMSAAGSFVVEKAFDWAVSGFDCSCRACGYRRRLQLLVTVVVAWPYIRLLVLPAPLPCSNGGTA
jgi:hypothetical protein